MAHTAGPVQYALHGPSGGALTRPPHWRVALDPGALWSDSAFQACGGLDAAQILDIYLSEDADWLDDVEGEEVVTVNVLEEAAGTYHEYAVTCQPGVALSWAFVASHALDPL